MSGGGHKRSAMNVRKELALLHITTMQLATAHYTHYYVVQNSQHNLVSILAWPTSHRIQAKDRKSKNR